MNFIKIDMKKLLGIMVLGQCLMYYLLLKTHNKTGLKLIYEWFYNFNYYIFLTNKYKFL